MTVYNEGSIKNVKVLKDGETIANFIFYATVRSYNWGFTHSVECSYHFYDKNVSGTVTAKATYYNRTWEYYRFQSCISSCLYSLLKDRKNYIINRIKEEKGWKKLTEKRRVEVEPELENDFIIKVFDVVKKEIEINADYTVEVKI